MPSVIRAEVKAELRGELLALWKANAARDAILASRKAAGLGARLEAAQGKSRVAFLKALDGNRSTRGIRKAMASIDKSVKALAKRPVRNAAQRHALEQALQESCGEADAIEKTHRSALLDAFENTVSAESYRRAMLKATKKPGRLEMKEGRFGWMRLNWDLSRLDLIDWNVLTHPQHSFAFEPPYDDGATVSEEFSALAGIPGAEPDAISGSVSISAFSVVAGYQMARAQLGAFLTIPSGFGTLRLQARIVDIRADVMAWAIPGGSWASSGPIAEVTDLTSSSTRRVEGSINYVVAPLLFYAKDLFEGATVFNAEFDIPAAGGEILVTAGLKCDVWSALLSGNSAVVDGTVEKITVELE